MADGTPVTATVRNGGRTPSDPGAVEEWLALMPPYGRWVSGRTVCPFRQGVASSEAETFCNLEGGLATLERGGDDPPPRGWARYPRARRRRRARSRALAGSPRARRRSPRGSEGGADGPHCVRGLRAGLLWVLSFLPDWKEAIGLRGLGFPACVCIFRVILVP